MKKVLYTLAARKAFKALPSQVQAQIEGKLSRYATSGAGDVTAMKGEDGARLRSGDYRVIFREADETIEVVAIGHRRDIYR